VGWVTADPKIQEIENEAAEARKPGGVEKTRAEMPPAHREWSTWRKGKENRRVISPDIGEYGTDGGNGT